MQILYLNDADVVACRLTPDDVRAAVLDILISKHRGGAVISRKLALPAGGSTSFSAKGGVWIDKGRAAVKWYGYAPDNASRGLPDFHPLIVLSRIDTGMPLAIIDGGWISAVRTAAITAVAAGVLANPQSSTIGFVACGLQARMHLRALREHFPLRRLTAYSRNRDTAERFAVEARDSGIDARSTGEPRDAVAGHDIIVTSIPFLSEPRGYLDGRWLGKHSFASMVDLGASWQRESLAALPLVITDELDPVTRQPTENLNFGGSFNAELAELLGSPSQRERLGHSGPSALIFGGTGLADVAAAVVVYERAQALGLGRQLAL